MGERIGWLDTARAIGIVAVVAGHVTTDRAIWAAMFHFHMPLFFMLSGMTFAPAPPHIVAARRTRTLLVPYAGWLVLVALGDLAIAAATGHPTYLPWDRPLAAVARALLGGTYLVGPFGIFWFVTCLFLVQIAAGAILRRPERQVVAVTGMSFVAVHLMRHWPSPLGVIGLPLGASFFLAGALYRRHVARFGRPAMLVALAAAALALVSAPLDVKIADYGTPVLSIVAALGLCHLVFVVAQHLPASRIVAAIGQASLVIMYLHLTILYALRDRFAAGPIALLGIVLPIAIWALLRRFGVTRTLLLGERTRTLDPGARSAQEAV